MLEEQCLQSGSDDEGSANECDNDPRECEQELFDNVPSDNDSKLDENAELNNAPREPVESAGEGEGMFDSESKSDFLVDVDNDVNNNNGPKENNVYDMDTDIDEDDDDGTEWVYNLIGFPRKLQFTGEQNMFLICVFLVCACLEKGYKHECHVLFRSFI